MPAMLTMGRRDAVSRRQCAELRWLLASLLGLLLAACAHGPAPKVELPPLRLSPASLGREVAMQQRLHFVFGGQQRDMDALLEADAEVVQLVVQGMGQVGVRLSWNGTELKEQRARWLPAAVRAERVLDDLQFALWPADAIRAVLPATWSLREDNFGRALVRDGTVWLSASSAGDGRIRLHNVAEGYRLEIESAASGEASP